MSDTEFKIISRNTLAPFRPRENLGDLIEFAGTGGRAAFLSPDIAAAMRSRARDALPNETGGLVLGRINRDDLGHYTLILGFVEAPSEASSPGTIQMSPAVVAELEEQAAIVYPGYEVIGWWHSHRSPSPFSYTDLQTQKLWTNESHVGLLVFASGNPWAVGYQGPTASLLETNVATLPLSPIDVATGNGKLPPNTKTTYLGAPPLVPAVDSSMVGERANTPKALHAALIAAATLVLGGAGIAAALSLASDAGHANVVNWTCRAGPATTVTCETDPVPGGELEWMLGDTVIGTGPVVDISDAATGSVSLRVRHTAVTDLGSLDLTTLSPPATTTSMPRTTVPPAPTTTVAPSPTTTVSFAPTAPDTSSTTGGTPREPSP